MSDLSLFLISFGITFIPGLWFVLRLDRRHLEKSLEDIRSRYL